MNRTYHDDHMHQVQRATHTVAWCKPAPVRTPVVRPSLMVRMLTALGMM